MAGRLGTGGGPWSPNVAHEDPVTCQPGGARQRAHGCRAAIEAGPPYLICLEQRDQRAELAALESGGYPSWSPAEYQQADLAAHRPDSESGIAAASAGW